MPRPGGSRRCRPRPGTPGSPPTSARCGPASSPWRNCHDRRRGPPGRHREPLRPAWPPGLPSPRCGWRGCTWSAAGPRLRSACWRPSACCCGPRCTGTGRIAGRPRRTAACPANDRDRSRRGHRGHDLRPVRRSRTGHRPLAALAAAGHGRCCSPRPRPARWPPGPSGGPPARRHPGHAPQPRRDDRHRPAGRGRARRRVRLDRPDGLSCWSPKARSPGPGPRRGSGQPGRRTTSAGRSAHTRVFAAGIVAVTLLGARDSGRRPAPE